MSGLLNFVRSSFINERINIDDVVSYYREWLDWIFYVVCYRFNYTKCEYEYAMFRGLKRGDDRYNTVVCRKFSRLYDYGRNLTYFAFGSRGYVRSSGLHVVLEYNSNVIGLPEAWLHVGVDFNRFMSRVRKLFGRVSIVRVFESHKSGYPHIHAILVFHDFVFSGYSSHRRGRFVYRTFGHDFASLKDCWVHGFSDFELVDSFRGGVRYLSKYLAKSTSARLSGVNGIRGLAMCWVFRKRSFSMSGSLFVVERERAEASASNDVIRYNGNSNLNSLSGGSFVSGESLGENSEDIFFKVGVDLFGNSIFEKVSHWYLFGFCLRDNVLWDD